MKMPPSYWKKLYSKKKDEAITLLGGVCTECGESENLQFHHKKRETKEFAITTKMRQNVSEEISKCVLLCKKCHKKEHSTNHGKRRMYNNGCRCKECVESNKIYFRGYKKRPDRQVA